MSAEDTKYDDTLFTMAKQSGGVQQFLEHITSFLRRRTKYFTETPNTEWEPQLLKIFYEEYKKLSSTIDTSKSNVTKEADIQSNEIFKLKPNEGKGCNLTNYTWTQTLKEIELKIPLNVCQKPLRARDIVVDIQKKFLKVGLKGQTMPIVSGELCREIKFNESTWMLDDDGSAVNLTLEKVKQNIWWDRLLVTDPAISLDEIEPEKVKLTDLDAQRRETVEKMLQNQRQRQMGILPSNNMDQKKLQLFEKFKETHPELDFSKCKFNG